MTLVKAYDASTPFSLFSSSDFPHVLTLLHIPSIMFYHSVTSSLFSYYSPTNLSVQLFISCSLLVISHIILEAKRFLLHLPSHPSRPVCGQSCVGENRELNKGDNDANEDKFEVRNECLSHLRKISKVYLELYYHVQRQLLLFRIR